MPTNMTHFFQSLDLSINGAAKQYMWKQFITYYSAVKNELVRGEKLKSRFTFNYIKTTSWLVHMCNNYSLR